MTPGAAIRATLATATLAVALARGAVPPEAPTCKVYLRTKVAENDPVGARFVDVLREQLLATREVALATSEDEATVVARIVTMRYVPNQTVATVVLYLHRALPGTSADVSDRLGPRTVDVLIQGPGLASYSDAAVKEGAERYVTWITDRRVLAACTRMQNSAPKPAE